MVKTFRKIAEKCQLHGKRKQFNEKKQTLEFQHRIVYANQNRKMSFGVRISARETQFNRKLPSFFKRLKWLLLQTILGTRKFLCKMVI